MRTGSTRLSLVSRSGLDVLHGVPDVDPDLRVLAGAVHCGLDKRDDQRFEMDAKSGEPDAVFVDDLAARGRTHGATVRPNAQLRHEERPDRFQ
jgi:hypothetical protein